MRFAPLAALVLPAALAFALASGPLAAQTGHGGHTGHAGHGDAAASAGYEALADREIKALSDEEVAALLAGEGMGFALAAELNGIAGPLHLLELREELALSTEQVEAISGLFQSMRAETSSLGSRVVELERTLDRRFAHRHVDPEVVRELTTEIARLKGEIRAIHLVTHLAVDPLLTEEQRAAYPMLRGYATQAPSPEG